jgi:hypothetical protein
MHDTISTCRSSFPRTAEHRRFSYLSHPSLCFFFFSSFSFFFHPHYSLLIHTSTLLLLPSLIPPYNPLLPTMVYFSDDAIMNNLEWVSSLSIDVEPSAVRRSSIICTIGNLLLLLSPVYDKRLQVWEADCCSARCLFLTRPSCRFTSYA